LDKAKELEGNNSVLDNDKNLLYDYADAKRAYNSNEDILSKFKTGEEKKEISSLLNRPVR